jgi:hypothetical protein
MGEEFTMKHVMMGILRITMAALRSVKSRSGIAALEGVLIVVIPVRRSVETGRV